MDSKEGGEGEGKSGEGVRVERVSGSLNFDFEIFGMASAKDGQARRTNMLDTEDIGGIHVRCILPSRIRLGRSVNDWPSIWSKGVSLHEFGGNVYELGLRA